MLHKSHQAAKTAAQQLKRLWLPPKAARLLQQPPPAKFNTPLLKQLMQQSTQHADVIAGVLNFGLQQGSVQQRPTQQQQQLQLQQNTVLILDFLGAPEYTSAECLLFELLTWLNSKPDLAADLWQNLGQSAAADRSRRKCGLQDMWLAGMQVWQLLLLRTAAFQQSHIGHEEVYIRTQRLLVKASVGELGLGCTLRVVTFVCVWRTCQETGADVLHCWQTRTRTLHSTHRTQLYIVQATCPAMLLRNALLSMT
jgi:hypothetical protein